MLSYVANAENAINIMVENMFLLWPKYACYREMTLTFWNLHFWGVCFFDYRTRVTYFSHLVYSNDIQVKNMSSNTCHFKFLCDTQAEKCNTALNSDP